MCVYGYDSPNFALPEKQYAETVIIAWSFGIPVAELIASSYGKDLNVTGMFAINGSWKPVDDELGIPHNIFNNTLEHLNEKNLLKFKMRICGGGREYKESSRLLESDSSIEQLKKELEFFTPSLTNFPQRSEPLLWDYVFISVNDLIFPVENLKKAWQNISYRLFSQWNHLPPFQNIIDSIIKDKSTIAKNFQRRKNTYDKSASIQSRIVHEMTADWTNHHEKGENILEIGSGTGLLTKIIREKFKPALLTMMDFHSLPLNPNEKFVEGDAETLIRTLGSESFDIIASSSTLQWFHSPTRFLAECHRILKKGGLIFFSVFTEGTLQEISKLTQKSLLYLSGKEWEYISQNNGFFVISRTDSQDRLVFKDTLSMLRHLSATGVNSLSGQRMSVKETRGMIRESFQKGEPVNLTYRWTTIILRK